jgi:DNA invertase Pin-like site-specific DNA recombinase
MSPAKKPTKPIDIYVRVSRTGGRDVEADGGTAAEQEKRCRAQLEALGLRAGEVFTDLDVSGGKTSRPDFDRAKARIADGASGGLIVLNLSRFGRNRRVDEDILGLEELGGTVIAVEEKLDTSTPSGRFALTILSAVNTLYLENVTEGWRRVQNGRLERGLHSGVPLGYARGAGGKLVSNGHADTVRAVFEARAAGKSWGECAALLNGIPTRKGSTVWTVPAVRGLVANRAYLGEASYGSRVTVDAHDPLVPAELFRRANKRLPRRASRGDGEGKLLAGLIRCASCGYGMSYEGTRSTRADGKVAHYAFYRCKSNPKCEAKATVMAHVVEPLVVELALEKLSAVSWTRGGEDSEELAAAEAALQAARANLAEVEELAGTRLPGGPLVEAVRDAEAALDAAVNTLGTPLETLVALVEDPGESGLAARFERLTVSQRRTVLREVLDRVEVAPGRGDGRVTVVGRDGTVLVPEVMT